MIMIRLRDLFRCDGFCATETAGGVSRLIRRDVTCSLHSASTKRLPIFKAGHHVHQIAFKPIFRPGLVDA